MFDTSGARGGSATDARVDNEKNAQGSSWTLVPCIEPAKPLVQVRDIQEVMSEVRGPLVCLVDWNDDCRLVSRCQSRRYSILCELRWNSACLAPGGTGKREASQARS